MARIRTVKQTKRAIPSKTRQAVAQRFGCAKGNRVDAQCASCGAAGFITWYGSRNPIGGWVHFSGLELDHIYPESKGGDASPSNIQLLCRKCNRSKGAK